MEKLWNKNYLRVMLVNFMMYFAFYLLTPLLPLYLSEQFGASNNMIGVVLSGYVVAEIVARLFSGYVVDSFDRRGVLLWSLSLFFVFFAGYPVAGTLLMFAIIRTLHGLPFGAVTVANSTAAIDVLPSSRRNEGLGFYGLSNNLSMAIAPSAGVFIYKWVNSFEELFWLSFFIAAGALFVASRIELPKRERKADKRPVSFDRFFLTRAWLLSLNIMFFAFSWGVLSSYIALYSKNVLGITGGTGTFFMLISIGLMASRLQGAKALRQGKLTQNAAEGMCISLVAYFMFIAFPSMFSYYASALLLGLGNGHLYPAFLNMFVGMAHHNERGTANSSILVSWGVGMGIGILLGGVVSGSFGYSAAFWMNWGVNAIGVVLFFAATRRFFLTRKIEE